VKKHKLLQNEQKKLKNTDEGIKTHSDVEKHKCGITVSDNYAQVGC